MKSAPGAAEGSVASRKLAARLAKGARWAGSRPMPSSRLAVTLKPGCGCSDSRES